MGCSAILAISRQSDVKAKLSRCKCNVSRPTLCINWQIGWQSIGDMNNKRSEDVIGSTVGLYTDLTHQGHTGRSAVLAISRQADVIWKVSRCKCNIKSAKTVHKLTAWVTVYLGHEYQEVWWRHSVDSRTLYWSHTPGAYRLLSFISYITSVWR
jgi:hypothetical protein